MYVCMYACMSCHVMSCHVMSCHVMSCHVMSCHVVSCCVVLCYVVLCCVVLCCVVLCCVVLCYVMLCYVMLCYVTVCYMTRTKAPFIWRKLAPDRRDLLLQSLSAATMNARSPSFFFDDIKQGRCRNDFCGSVTSR